jgi:hypothetical protein
VDTELSKDRLYHDQINRSSVIPARHLFFGLQDLEHNAPAALDPRLD